MDWQPPQDEQVQWSPPSDEAQGAELSLPQKLQAGLSMLPDAPWTKALNTVSAPFHKAGEYVAEKGGELGVNPNIAAGVGTGISMIPSVATMLSPGGETQTENTLAQYAKRIAQNQAMKTLGASGGQIGQIGAEDSRRIAQKLLDQGVIAPLRGPIGLEETVKGLSKQAGQEIGDIRNAADKAGQAPQMTEILDAVKKHVEPQYASGVEKGMAQLNRAREEIAKGGTGTFVGNARKATEMNEAAKKNALYRPQGPVTSTADVISRLNNESLKRVVPDKTAPYEKALGDWGDYEAVKDFLARGERKELSGHMTHNPFHAITEPTVDAFGNRIVATGANQLGNALKYANPGNASRTLAAYLVGKEDDNADR